ncbi:MAG TPA: sugar-binding protein [Polyangiaceae bacterium]
MTRAIRLLLLWGLALFGCEAIAGYNDVEPWPRDAGSSGRGGADAAISDGARDVAHETSPSDGEAGISDADVEAGPCMMRTGNDACSRVPRFTAARQVVDSFGDEFCNIEAMVFDVDSCPTLIPSEPPSMPESVHLRIGWSADAFHLHVRVEDPSVLVNPDPNRLWDGDAVEIYIAGVTGEALTGSYNGRNDGGAIQIVLAPPGAGFDTRGRAYINPGADVHVNTPITSSFYAGRLTEDGYELELRYPWLAFAEPAVEGARIAFDLAVDARDDSDASGRQIQCIISNVFVAGESACGFTDGRPAEPWCDDRTWCRPTLQ